MITLAEAKAHLRVDVNDDDSLITNLISAAYQFAENYTNRVILQRTETLILDDLSGVIELPYLPVISINTIAYKDTSDAPQAFSDYYLNLRELFAKVSPKQDFSWPETNEEYENTVITYEAGYASIPEQINSAVKLMITDLYENRGEIVIGVSVNTTGAINSLLNNYRVVSI